MADTRSLSGLILSGPVVVGLAGLMAGTGLALGGSGLTPLSNAQAHQLGMAIAASALLLGVAWALIADRAAQANRIRALETGLQRLAGQMGAFGAIADAAAQQGGSSEQVAAELKVLQKLLQQVVQRRTNHIAPPAASNDVAPRSSGPQLAIPNRMPEEEALDIMRGALEDSRIDLYLQPLVRLPSRRTVHYEAFSRVRLEDGSIVFPHDYLYPAQSAGMVATLDNVLLFRCISLIRSLGPRRQGTRLFVNLALGSLLDPGFMADFVRFMRQHVDLSGRLVFEIADGDHAQLGEETLQQLMLLSDAGFVFSIDQLESLDADIGRFQSINVQYVKVSAARLLAGSELHDCASFRRMVEARGMELIATHIEDERTVIEILDEGIGLAQGYLFGKPRPAREGDARAA